MIYMLISLLMIFGIGWLMAKQASISVWAITYALISIMYIQYGDPSLVSEISIFIGFSILALGHIKTLRMKFFSKPVFSKVSKVTPKMSQTERAALEAGTVGWDAEIFSGNPNFDLLTQHKAPTLTKEEQDFLDGPTNALCRMLDDWDITHNYTDLPEEVWGYIKEQGFLGMIIPKIYGGLEFSALAQVAVLVKLYGRSVTAATTIGVPNSLGPAELLLNYGTEEQKDYYLPRLAKGIEIPCFALTSPNAGSDAASIPDKGIVCKQIHNGIQTLGVRLNWDKRYITLCPVATIIGLAFRLYDPENLIGKVSDVGITCALIPANTAGVTSGRRHFPLNTGFLNGPTQGDDVFIPIDFIIGGEKMAGKGWTMLMECLSAGRAISLPSSAVGGMQAAALASGAYSRIRRQFNTNIANFEGIEEPLARIAGSAYLSDAALMMTAAAIDRGEKPSVVGAILKYHTTERARKVAMDSMDIHGGKGICLGPNNYLGRAYQASPISITVEGANILTRNLIIFGQGAIRCHPFIFSEMESIRNNDLDKFDKAFCGHVSFSLANFIKSICFSFTDARLTKAPKGLMHRNYQLIHRYSTNLAFLSDFSMIILGGALKRKEKISARLGDVLSNLYMASAVLQRFHYDGQPAEDLPLVQWCCDELFYDSEDAIAGVISNFPVKWARFVLKAILQPFGLRRYKPSDKLGQKVASILSTPNSSRGRLTRFVFAESLANCPIGKLEDAFEKICAIEPLEKLVIQAARAGKFNSLTFIEQIYEAKQQEIINNIEAKLLHEAELARQQVIAVDDFDDSDLRRNFDSSKDKQKKNCTSAGHPERHNHFGANIRKEFF